MKAVFCLLFVLLFSASCSSPGSKSSTTPGQRGRNARQDYVFSRDSVSIYFSGKLVQVVHKPSFRILSGGYACDDSTGYFEGKRFEAACPRALRYLGGGYAKDGYEAYYRGKTVATAQSSSFCWLGGDTAKDTFDVYIKGIQQYKNNEK